jgi:hypothetical protein
MDVAPVSDKALALALVPACWAYLLVEELVVELVLVEELVVVW